MRLRSAWEFVSELGAALYVVAFVLVLVVLLLMLLGVGLLDVSKAIGEPLPSVHDDPNRVEVTGLLVLVGYGLAVLAAGVGVYAAVRAARGLPFLDPDEEEHEPPSLERRLEEEPRRVDRAS
jgi:hypothetical protein